MIFISLKWTNRYHVRGDTTCKNRERKYINENNVHIFCPDPPSVIKHNELYATNGACKLLYGVSGVVNLYIIKLFYYCYTG